MHVSNLFTSVPARSRSPSGCSPLAGAPTAPRSSSATAAPRPTRPRSSSRAARARTARIVAAEGAFHGRTIGRARPHPQARLPGAVRAARPRRPLRPVRRRRRAASAPSPTRRLRRAARADPGRGRRASSPPPGYLRGAPARSRRRPGRCSSSTRCRPASGAPARWFAFHAARASCPTSSPSPRGSAAASRSAPCWPSAATSARCSPPGTHGSTFGGNPLACAAGLAVLDTIEREGLLDHAREAGEHLEQRIAALDHPQVTGIRGAGLLRAIALAGDVLGRRRGPGPRRRLHRQPGGARRHPARPAAHRHRRRARPVRRRAARPARRRPRPGGRPMTLRHFLADDDLTPAEQRDVLDLAVALKADPLLRPAPRRPAHRRDPVRQADPAHPGVVRRRGRRASAASRW